MNGDLTFSVRQIVSDAGGGVNDDAAGARANAIWVLDGATGASDVACTSGPTDAAWLARFVSDWLRKNSDPVLPLLHQLPQLQDVLCDAFAKEGHAAEIAQEDTPSACLGIVEYDARHGTLEIGLIGDLSVVIASTDGTVRYFTDPSVERFGARSLAIWCEARLQGASLEEAWKIVRPAIRENRRMVNRPEGYWVVNPVMPWLEGVRYHSVPAEAGMRVMLVSDGYFRLVDVLGHCDDRTLLESSFALGLEVMVATLRRIETEDPDCLVHARMKPHDDATAIIAVLERTKMN